MSLINFCNPNPSDLELSLYVCDYVNSKRDWDISRFQPFMPKWACDMVVGCLPPFDGLGKDRPA